MRNPSKDLLGPRFVVLSACLASPLSSLALIDLDFRPQGQNVRIGATVSVSLYAVSDDNTNQSLAAMDIIVKWNPTYLNPISFTNSGNGYQWFQSGFLLPGGLNSSLSDGDALWTAFSRPGEPAQATPQGLKVTTFQFTAREVIRYTRVTMPRQMGNQRTIVYDGSIPNRDVTGEIDPGAFVTIYNFASPSLRGGMLSSGGPSAVPEPRPVVVLGLAVAALAVSRRLYRS